MSEIPAHHSAGIDPNKLVAEVLTKAAQSAIHATAKKGQEAVRTLALKSERAFSGYFEASLRRFSTIKTILNPGNPQPLRSIYIPTDLVTPTGDLSTPGIKELESHSLDLIVEGTAGSGKSTFFRHLFLNCYERGERIPVLVELRDGNETTSDPFEQVLEELQDYVPSFTKEELEKTLQWGKFCFLFDGFDEVTPERRAIVERRIKKLTNRFWKNQFIVSSRPNIQLGYWENFRTVKMKKLSIAKSESMLERLDFDDEIKSAFLRELRAGMWARHESFASNPLLLSIMLLAFAENPEIPHKRHLLYEQMFLTLLSRHDASKGSFKRPYVSGLPKDDLERVLRAFSARTLMKQKLTFSDGELNEHFRLVTDLSGVSFEFDLLKQDFLEALCFLQRDGQRYTFTHRSFQEYFAAQYLLRSEDDLRNEILKHVRSSPAYYGNFLSLLYEMDRELVEQYYVLPKVEQLLRIINAVTKPGADSLARLAKLLVKEIHRDAKTNRIIPTLREDNVEFLTFLRRSYPDISSYFAVEGDDWRVIGGLMARLNIDTITANSFIWEADPALTNALESTGVVSTEDIWLMIRLRERLVSRSRDRKTAHHLLGIG